MSLMNFRLLKQTLTQRPYAKKILTNSAWLTLERIVEIISITLVGLYVAKELGTEKFGTLSYALIYCALFSFLGPFGIGHVVVKDLTKKPENKHIILGSAFVIVLVGQATMMILIASSAMLLGDKHLMLILIFGGSFFLELYHPIDYYFQATLKSKYSAIARIFASVISVCGRLFLVAIEAPLYWFACAAIISSLVRLGSYICMYWIIGEKLLHWRSSIPMIKSLFLQSWPLCLNNAVVGIYSQIDIIMIGKLAGMEAVGIYATAMKIITTPRYFMMTLYTSTTPILMHAFKRNKEEFWDKFRKVSGLFAWCGFWFYLILWARGNFIVTSILGMEFDAGALLYGILSLRLLISFPAIHQVTYLIVSGNTHIQFFAQMIGICVNISLNFLLIPHFGLEGAALATAATFAIVSYGAHYIFERSFPLVGAYHKAWKSAIQHEFLYDFYKAKYKKDSI